VEAPAAAAADGAELPAPPEVGQRLSSEVAADIDARNRRLINYKRVTGYLVWDRDFPRTASMKVKRLDLAEQIRKDRGRHHVVYL
ncbi:MAG TPA: hypothetical protein VNK23_08630, partial [Candidatus Dormibacteraeota bacterium]|nr:hypothetical protein [Candidatus Dormibacteraeota bacterium]